MSKPRGKAREIRAAGAPGDLALEKTILGSTILDPRLLEDAYGALPPTGIASAIEAFETSKFNGSEPLFFSTAHEFIFGAICYMRERGMALSLSTLAAVIKERTLLDSIGGTAYLATLENDVFSLNEFPELLKLLIADWSKRALIRGYESILDASKAGQAPAQIAEQIERDVLRPVLDCQPGGRSLALSPGQIRRLPRQEDSNWLGDHMLQAGEPTIIAGPPELGKSRLVQQLILSIALGRPDWLGLPIHRRDLRIISFPVEDSIHRKQMDLDRQLSGIAQEEETYLDDTVRIYAPTRPEDRIVWLDDEATVNKLTTLVREHRADLVIFDPYAAFFAGEDENQSMQARQTMTAMARISRAGNPDAALLVVHHSRIGREATAGAIGWERGAYIRGSKALTAMSRAQINFAPVDPDDRDLILVSCGKCSNGRPFEPFAIRLDPGTMRYHPDPTFSLDDWKANVQEKGFRPGPRAKISDVLVLALMQEIGGAIKRSTLVERISTEAGCNKTAAYQAIKKLVDEGRLNLAAGYLNVR